MENYNQNYTPRTPEVIESRIKQREELKRIIERLKEWQYSSRISEKLVA